MSQVKITPGRAASGRAALGRAASHASPCSCQENGKVDSCCELVCFERPNYFCGHLLTDEDLSLEQRYARDKRKLYHRTLDGHGVVCGLRLTCDGQCPGGICVDEGFAIDDCGNDLVLCESARVDVIGLLRAKGWLLETPVADPCAPNQDQPECRPKQCFYVVACYDEEPSEHTTPFVASCHDQVSDCQPTRIREGVRFDLLAELPEKKDFLSDLRERLTGCFDLLSHGPFAQALQDGSDDILEVLTGNVLLDKHQVYYDLFCRLRGLFLLYLEKHPALYSCTFADELRHLAFPTAPIVDATGEVQMADYANRLRLAFCALLEKIWQYVIDCAFGELVPPCSEPDRASCVVLGTVEVEKGRVVRVCNCPRDYVWSFANFFETLTATLFGQLACTTTGRGDKQDEKTCCRTFELDCELFTRLNKTDHQAFAKASTASIDAVDELRQATQHAFDFTRQDAFSPKIFQGASRDEWSAMAAAIGIESLKVEEAPLDQAIPHLAEMARRVGLAQASEGMVLSAGKNGVVSAHADRRAVATLAADERASLEKHLKEAKVEAAAASAEVAVLKSELAERSKELVAVKKELVTVTKKADKAHKTLDADVGKVSRQLDTRSKKIEGQVGKIEKATANDRKKLESELATVKKQLVAAEATAAEARREMTIQLENGRAESVERMVALERRLDELSGPRASKLSSRKTKTPPAKEGKPPEPGPEKP